jgi:hypothetical protein
MHKRSFGWITRKIHNKIKYLKVPTYELSLFLGYEPSQGCNDQAIREPTTWRRAKDANDTTVRHSFDSELVEPHRVAPAFATDIGGENWQNARLPASV